MSLLIPLRWRRWTLDILDRRRAISNAIQAGEFRLPSALALDAERRETFKRWRDQLDGFKAIRHCHRDWVEIGEPV